MLVVQKFMFLRQSTKEVKMLCPTRFILDSTEVNKEGGVAADIAYQVAPTRGYEQNKKCCRMTKIQAQLYGMQTHKAFVFVIYS